METQGNPRRANRKVTARACLRECGWPERHPDPKECILTLSPGQYSEAHPVFSSKSALTTDQLRELETFFNEKEPITPEGAPILILGGGDDYALAPLVKAYPSQLLEQLAEIDPERKLKFTTMSQYLDAIQPGIASGGTKIPT